MSNRVVCREASHAGSWYTASGRAPGRPARRRRLAPRPPGRGRRPCPARGGRDLGADGLRRGPRGEGADRGPRRRLPHPGGIPLGSPGPVALAHTPELGEWESCRPAACAVLPDRALGKNALPVPWTEPAAPPPAPGKRAAGRCHPGEDRAPGSRATRSRATLRPPAEGGPRSPPLSLPPRRRCEPREFSERVRAHRPCPPSAGRKCLLPSSSSERGSAPSPLGSSAVWIGADGRTCPRRPTRVQGSAGEVRRGRPWLGFVLRVLGVGSSIARQRLGVASQLFVSVCIVTVIHERGSWRWHQRFSRANSSVSSR